MCLANAPSMVTENIVTTRTREVLRRADLQIPGPYFPSLGYSAITRGWRGWQAELRNILVAMAVQNGRDELLN